MREWLTVTGVQREFFLFFRSCYDRRKKERKKERKEKRKKERKEKRKKERKSTELSSGRRRKKFCLWNRKTSVIIDFS